MSDLAIGRVLGGRFRLEGALGEGATGSVFRAADLETGGAAAIKVLWPEIAHLSEVRQRFDREARALAGLQHPHVIQVIEFGAEDDVLYLAMELLEGWTLDNVIEHEPLEPAFALGVADQILAGLGFAHQLGIVHRDVKAENVFLAQSPEGMVTAKLLDFGLAKFADRTSWGIDASLTATGTLLGTPGYMPPEQAFGAKVDARCDVYSAGVLLFELLTGHWPFYAEELPELLRAHAVEPVPALADRRPDLIARPELEAVVRRALEKRPEARFPDAGAMRAALRAVPTPGASVR